MSIIDEIQVLQEALKDDTLNAQLDKFVSSFTEGGLSIDKMQTAMQNMAGRINDIGKSGSQAADDSAKFDRSLINVMSSIEHVTLNLFGASKGFSAFQSSATTATGSIGDSFNDLSKSAETMKGVISGIAGAFKLGPVNDFIGKVVTNMVQATDRVQTLEKGYISLMSSTGNLGSIFDDTGTKLNNFDEQVIRFTDTANKMAMSTGFSTAEIMKLQQTVGQIPDALTTQIDFMGTSINQVDAATKLASGTGQPLAKITSDLTFAYETLNKTGKDAVDFIAQLSTTSEDLHVGFGVVEGAVESAAKSYEFLTNKTEGVTRALRNFIPAMTEAGLSPQQGIKMFQQMNDALSNMDTGAKAFLASRSGLGGGLQGAFKIDSMLQQGKQDEVLKMAQDNLKKQLGGNIVTLGEAGESQQAATQYQKQLSYLKSSAFGGLIKDDKQASKLFDSMRNGLDFTSKDIVQGPQAAERVMGRGDNVQQRMNTAVNKIAADVEKIAQARDFKVAEGVRSVIGGGEGGMMSDALQASAHQAGREAGQYSKDNKRIDNKDNYIATTTSEAMSDLKLLVNSLNTSKSDTAENPKITAMIGAVVSKAQRDDDAMTRKNIASGKEKSSGPVQQVVNTDVVRQAVNQNMRSSVSDPLASTARGAVSGANPVLVKMAPATINVKGTIEGICLNCQQITEGNMDEGSVVQVVQDMQNQAAGQQARRQ